MKIILILALLLAPATGFSGELKNLPNLAAITVDGGDKVSLLDLKGEPLFLVYGGIGAGWCPPCRAMVSWLKKQKEMWRGLNVVELHPEELCNTVVSKGTTCADGLLSEAKRLKISWPVWITKDGEIEKAFRLVGLPTVFAFDAKGKYVGTYAGFGGEGDDKAWEELQKRAMKGYKFPGKSKSGSKK